MSKAIAGAAILGAAGLGYAASLFATGGLGAIANTALFIHILEAVAVAGLSSEAGAVAQALSPGVPMAITSRQAASPRQIVYGQQRVSGVVVYQNTTGSSHDQYNYIIVLAGHEIHSIQNLYLDGRQVFWLGSGTGWAVRNGVGFGGIADSNSHTGPNGVQYNFGGTGHSGIFAEARYGDQLPGDVIGSLTANDPNWAADGEGNSPFLGGCAYIYLKIENNTNVFPAPPEIRVTVNGKDSIFDPRTGTTGFTSNWALIAADVITDPIFGMGDNTVNQAQLIAAANVCDEQVALSVAPGNLTEARYTTNWHYGTDTAPVDTLQTMMTGAAGRISRVGGEWYLWPAYWQGPTATFDESSLKATMQWKPKKSKRDLYNRVNGTYTAPSYPYNIAGNLYDQNGFFDGMAQNNFPFGFTESSAPQYASDVLHGFASDQFLNQDGGKQLPMELDLPTVLSVTQWQRVAKINLLRNRQQGSGSFEMGMEAFGVQPADVINFNFVNNGWNDKLLEVQNFGFKVTEAQDGSPSIGVSVAVAETDPSIYAWNPTLEELGVSDQPDATPQTNYIPAPPTDMTLNSSAATAVLNADGTVTPRIQVTWDTPMDALAKQIQIQYQPVGSPVWLSAPSVDVSLNLGFISGVVAGQQYNVQIRSARANGAFSVWVQELGYTVSITLPAVTSEDQGLNPGGLIGEAFAGGAAAIEVIPFTATFGNLHAAILPAGPFTINGLVQATLYYVYYSDPTFAGGAITPIATTNKADFLGIVGLFLIDSIVTPISGSGGGTGGGTSPRFMPTSFSDSGSRTTLTPAAAYDGNTSSAATVSGSLHFVSGGINTSTIGDCTWQGFTNFVTLAPCNLNVIASVNTDDIRCTLLGAGQSLFATTTAVSAPQTYTVAIPVGTNLSGISVECIVDGSTSPGLGDDTASVSIFEIFIQ